MTPLLAATAQFILCSVLILVAGARLSRYGDVIAEKTGLGGTWIGLVLLATVTSLPELVTGASSVILFDVIDIAAGDIVGSCLFNLVILAMLDAGSRVPLFARIHQGHALLAGFGIVQMSLLAFALAAGSLMPALGWIGLPSFFFVGGYIFAMRTIFIFERNRMRELAEAMAPDTQYDGTPLGRTMGLFLVFAAILVLAATLLPGAAEHLSHASGLGQSFVGTMFVAVSTSLPEVAVSIAAARIGAIDMAAANLFGSNLFNVAVMGVDDVLYVRGPLLASVSPIHGVTIVAAILMTAIAIVGLMYRTDRKRLPLSWDSLSMLAVYLASMALLARWE